MTAPVERVDGELRLAGRSLAALVRDHGSPLYAYDLDRLEDRFRDFSRAFLPLDLLVGYSVAANPSPAVLSMISRLGGGAAVASGGELALALEAGVPADRIVFGGVGKSRREMAYGLREGVLAFNVESRHELEQLADVADELGVVAPFALRLNLDLITPKAPPFIPAGSVASKFGVLYEEALELYRWSRSVDVLSARGIHVHAGSQIRSPEPYEKALSLVLKLGATLRDEGDELDFVNLGGGFAVDDGHSPGLPLDDLAKKVVEGMWLTGGMRLILEPGRYLVGPCGVMVTRVLHVKRVGGKVFVITEGGMSELCRATAHGGHHEVEPVVGVSRADREPVDVVGPLGEPGDFIALGRPMTLPGEGDLLAVWPAGAYALGMLPSLNSRPRPGEIALRGDGVEVLRAREGWPGGSRDARDSSSSPA